MKKRIHALIMAMIILVACVSVTANAADENAISPRLTPSTGFSFWIHSSSESEYRSTAVEKTTNSSVAWVYNVINIGGNSSTPPTYWPQDGVTLRVKNQNNQNATIASAFSFNETDSLSYFTGQNYTGKKWLYGNISGANSAGYGIGITGTWLP